MELRVLGSIEVVGPDGPVDIGARSARVLVALLAADQHRLDLDGLIERSFGDDERPDDPVPAIRTAVVRLRRVVGADAIVTRPGGYELDRRSLDLDMDRFDELIAAGRAAADPVAAVTSFRRALDLWRGRPFGELADLDWLTTEGIRLEESHLLALEGWHDGHLRSGTVTEIMPSLESATVEHPLRERFHRQLMHALFVVDRQADALRAFQKYRESMAEVGLEPGRETVELERRIASGDSSLRATSEGRPLRGYRIVERLGEGAFSIVYRGTQPSVDRNVAIKQIRAELANRPDFIRRFEAEAHMVARLEHPFIVPLYDYWREPGSAYLVMRLLSGGSLESSLRDGPWDVDRTSRMLEQVGAALSVAHRTGVVHRDVKPANILLDDEGNSFLTDFGIALAESEMVDPQASLSAGSPAYASPEQLRREPVGPSADVHGLAIAVYEALTGRRPFPDEPTQAALLQRQLHDPIPLVRTTRVDVPSELDEVLQRATAKRAADRYQSVEDFVAAYLAAIDAPAITTVHAGATVVPTEDRNPYKGLRAFDEADSGDFSGRDRLVDQLAGELAANRIVAVVGPSGSGKSSAVRAGLLPSLRSGALAGSESWFVAKLMPGSHPDEELEAALLRIATDRPPGLLEVLRDGDRGISRALRQVLPEDGQLLLVVDQFEELFTLCDDEIERRRFLDGLAVAVTEERSRLRVILTLRADFYDRPLRYESIGRLVRDATVPVLPLAADELEQAIVDPARSVGAEFEPGLVSEIVADVSDQPGALPLLQYALTELYDRRVSNLLLRDSYRSIGGVTGALAARAEELYAASSLVERDALRRLFGRLVTLGEGTDDTRRRVSRAELTNGDSVESVIDRFGRARLLSFDRDPVSREPTIEVAHEALLREWPRLCSWLDDDRDGLRTHRHLTETAAAWVASGRDDGELYRGGRLETAGAWAAEHGDDLNEAEREFLSASVAQRTAEKAAEQAHAEQQARSNRRLRVLATIATVVAVIAGVAGVFALQQQSQAEDAAAEAAEARAEADQNARDAARQRDAADLQRLRSDAVLLAEQALNTAAPDAALALLLSVELDRLAPSLESTDALFRAFTAGGSTYYDVGSDWIGSALEEPVPIPADQLALLQENPTARLYTAVLERGDVILTSVDAGDRTSTVVRHERRGGRLWETTDTGIAAVVTNAGDFTTWVSSEAVVVRGPNGEPLGEPIPRPPDLVSFTLSDNGEVLVLQRRNAVFEVYRSSGSLIGVETMPGAGPDADFPDSEFSVSMLADGSRIAAFPAYEPIGPWAIWTTNPLGVETFGGPGSGAAGADADRSLDRPTLVGSLLFSNFGASASALDPVTREPVGGRFEDAGLLLSLTDSEQAGLHAGVRYGFDLGIEASVRIWDSATGARLSRELSLAAAVSQDDLQAGRIRYHTYFDGSGRLIVQRRDSAAIWNFDVSTWPDIACETAGRNMTRDEWERYGPIGVEYRKVCDQYPIED